MKDQLIQEILQIDEDIAALATQIRTLQNKRHDLIPRLIEEFGHNYNGEKTYKYDLYDIKITTKNEYKVDKALYESLDIPSEYNCVRKEIKYHVSKTNWELIETTAPQEIYDKLKDVITMIPKDPSLKIGLRNK